MKKSILIALLAACCNLPAFADQVIEVTDGWSFRQARSNNAYPATVPGCVHTDLINNGIIEDPYYRLNERNVQWIDKEDWEYTTKVWIDPVMLKHDKIRLECDGLDTYCDVYVNGVNVIKADTYTDLHFKP